MDDVKFMQILYPSDNLLEYFAGFGFWDST